MHYKKKELLEDMRRLGFTDPAKSVMDYYREQEGAIKQALNIARHPWLVGNVCLMPDTHEGYGMPIGGVVALKGAVCPNMVGVDIGCGMLAVATGLKDLVDIVVKLTPLAVIKG